MLLSEETLIGLLPLLLAKYYIIVVSRAEFLSWVKTTVLIVLVVSAIPFVPRKDFAVVTLAGVNVVLKESFALKSVTVMILFSVIYSINLPMSVVTAKCRKVVKRTRLITLHTKPMLLITNL